MTRKKTPTCKYHCRTCGSHFTSLAAFDAHKPRNRRDGSCVWPEKAPLGEIPHGECRIASERLQEGVTLYEHESAADAREHFRSAA